MLAHSVFWICFVAKMGHASTNDYVAMAQMIAPMTQATNSIAKIQIVSLYLCHSPLSPISPHFLSPSLTLSQPLPLLLTQNQAQH